MSAPRLAGLLAALGLLALGAAWLLRAAGPEPGLEAAHAPAKTRGFLLPDLGGPIRLATATASSARRSPLRSAGVVTELGRRLPRDIELLLLTNDAAAFALEAEGRRVRFVELAPELSLTMWPQDPFVVLRREDGRPALLASRGFDRADDAHMAEALASSLHWPLERSSLYFEGGNIVSDEAFVYVGADTIARNVAEQERAPEAIAAAFEASFGRPIVVIGPEPQPIAHIDLVVTPLGSRRLLVADPGRGARLAAAALRTAPETVQRFEQRAHDAFFGDSGIRHVALADGTELSPPALDGGTKAAIETSLALAPGFDALAASLARSGFEVERVPLLVGGDAVRPSGPPPEGDAPKLTRTPGYPVLSYNNALLEEREGRRRVYLPRYGLAALDEAGRAAWLEAGFEVVPIDGLTTSAMYGGALRCALKVLRRDE